MDDGDSASGDGSSNGEGSTPAALQSVANLPTLGEPIDEAGRVVVAFEDPACPTCKSFHESDLPDVRSELIEGGYASLVWRPFRFVSEHYPWNAPAIHAMLAATAQDEAAGWDLLDFYYGEQGSLSADDVVAETRSFVEASLSIDADAVVEAMETDAHAALLAESESVGEDAGVTSTPTFLLFEDSEYLTARHGSTSVTEFRAGFEA